MPFADFLHSADIQSTGASLAVMTDSELHHASVDDHGEGSHLLAPDEECIIGENQATTNGQHAYQQECEGSFDGSLCEQPDVITEVDTCIGPSQSIGDVQNTTTADKQYESAAVESHNFCVQSVQGIILLHGYIIMVVTMLIFHIQ